MRITYVVFLLDPAALAEDETEVEGADAPENGNI